MDKDGMKNGWIWEDTAQKQRPALETPAVVLILPLSA